MADAEMVWVNIETSGLSTTIDFILEIAVAVTDKDGTWIDGESWLLPPFYRPKNVAVERAKRDSLVGPMHEKSGLWKDLESAPDLAEPGCEGMILDYVLSFDFDDLMPMCGSSVSFDRKFIAKYMPQLDSWFHYRIVDNSSTKELCKLHAPTVYQKMKETLVPQKIHRGLPDLADTVEEYIFYKENFLVTE